MEEEYINRELLKKQKENLFKILKLLIDAIESRDKYWHGHSERVTEMAVNIACKIGLSEERLDILKWAGYLHDIGSATTKLSLLHKTENLAEREKEELKNLPLVANELLSSINDFKEVARIIFHKSEKFDGSGYPEGLSGDNIPIEARILSIAEAYDSLRNIRPYRPGYDHSEALDIISDGSGTRYDPHIVKIFIDYMKCNYKDINTIYKKIPGNEKIDEKQITGKISEASLVVYGFGIPKIYINGNLVEDKMWNTRKSKLLFLYLLSQREQKITEDKIIDILWTDSSIEKARQNLYNAVHYVRKVIASTGIPAKEVINISHSTYRLNPHISYWYDVNEFEKLYSSGIVKFERNKIHEGLADFKECVNLYNGRFLETYYEDWSVNYGYQLQEKYIYILKELARLFIDRREYNLAILYGQNIIKEDMCDQDGHYFIMESYFSQGKMESAVKQYLQCVQILQDEMGMGPSQRLTDIYLKAKGDI